MTYTPKIETNIEMSDEIQLWARQDSNLHAQWRGLYRPLPAPAGGSPNLN